jgi:hypothetical protein
MRRCAEVGQDCLNDRPLAILRLMQKIPVKSMTLHGASGPLIKAEMANIMA